MGAQPFVDVLAVTDFRLQCRQRLRPRFEFTQARAVALPGVGRFALPLLQRFDGLLQRRQRFLLAREFAVFRRELLFDFAQGIARRGAKARELLLQALLSRRQLRERVRSAVASCFGDPNVLLGQCDPGSEIGQRSRSLRDRLLECRQR